MPERPQRMECSARPISILLRVAYRRILSIGSHRLGAPDLRHVMACGSGAARWKSHETPNPRAAGRTTQFRPSAWCGQKAVVSRCIFRNLICNENHTHLDWKLVGVVERSAPDLDCNTKYRWLAYWRLATGGVCQGLPILMVIPAGAVSALSRTAGVCSRAHESIRQRSDKAT